MLPRDIAVLEKDFRKKIRDVVTRGAVNVKVGMEIHREDDDTPLVDVNLAKRLHSELALLKENLRLNGTISVSDLLSIPDINLFRKHIVVIEKISSTAFAALDQALGGLIATKTEEGKSLQNDLNQRHSKLLDFLQEITRLAPNVPVDYRKKMVARIQENISELQLDDERIFKEVAIFADRCDISEEITRISSHLLRMRELIKSDGPVGRKLDFLIQEIFREINTIGAKANDFEISSLVINFKTELERVREQAQNIE